MPSPLKNRVKIAAPLILAMALLLQSARAGIILIQINRNDATSLDVVKHMDGHLDASAIRNNLQKVANVIPAPLWADDDANIGDGEDDTTSQMTIAPTSRASQNWMLLIGIDKYFQLSHLNNCVDDLKTVRDILTEQYTFDRENVMELFDEQATRENIIKKFEELARKVKPNDNVLIYYAGHGVYNRTFKRGYWLPVDAGTGSTAQYLPSTDLQTFLGAIKSRSILVISDACFSGALFAGGEKSVPFRPTLPTILQAAKLKARQILTSGSNEPVADGWMFLDKHSLFAHYLIAQLSRNTDKYLTAGSLFERVMTPVSDKGFETPEYKTIPNTGDEGGEFLFVSK